ncbi:glutathione S-transferase [Xylariaceae sp. FL1019]|nr:glutathione S-transferase [Xylariaceae sp. FL1019]
MSLHLTTTVTIVDINFSAPGESSETGPPFHEVELLYKALSIDFGGVANAYLNSLLLFLIPPVENIRQSLAAAHVALSLGATPLTLHNPAYAFPVSYTSMDHSENRLGYPTLNERHLCNQWLHFQVSGQGPYYGQLGWFGHLHAEKIPSAIQRYRDEIKRVLGVLETALAARPADSQWLVGDKMTFADMSFVPWNSRLSEVLSEPWNEVWERVTQGSRLARDYGQSAFLETFNWDTT